MKNRTCLALMLAGVVAFGGGMKTLVDSHIKSNEMRKSLPARVYEVHDEKFKLERQLEKDLKTPLGFMKDRIAYEFDPEIMDRVKRNVELQKEWDSYAFNPKFSPIINKVEHYNLASCLLSVSLFGVGLIAFGSGYTILLSGIIYRG